MLRNYTAADLLAVSEGKLSLHHERECVDQPQLHQAVKPAVATKPTGLPVPRRKNLTASDILAISKQTQPWRALRLDAAPLSDAG